MLAGLTVRLASGFAEATRAMSPPDEQPHQRLAREMGVVAEVACALTVSERSASALLAQSHELTTTLPLTQAALEQGSCRGSTPGSWSTKPPAWTRPVPRRWRPISWTRTRRTRPGGARPGRWSRRRFRHKARTWRERHHPVSIEKRHAKSVLDRRLEYAPDRDGMAWLSAYLPADQAAGIWNGITAAARALQGPTEDRTITQLRADVAAKLLLSAGFTTSSPTDGSTDSRRQQHRFSDQTSTSTSTSTGTSNDGVAGGIPVTDGVDDAVAGLVPAPGGVDAGRVPSPAAQVLVTVPVFALMGLTDEPADLDGYGPIPASMARKLVADGASSFRRVLIDPRDGAPLEIGRDSYRIPASMRQWLRMRDGKCSFPGCNNQSLDNEADHILAWADGGTTGISNLGSAVPQTPPAETHHGVDTHRSHQRRTTRLDLTHRPPLPKRTPGLGTTPMATRKPRGATKAPRRASYTGL